MSQRHHQVTRGCKEFGETAPVEFEHDDSGWGYKSLKKAHKEVESCNGLGLLSNEFTSYTSTSASGPF